MKKIGLTGVLGSGKTTAAKYFQSLGVPVFIADNSAKYLMVKDLELRNQIVELLGPESYSNDKLNKEYVSDKIFNSKELLNSINELVHPAVNKDFDGWVIKQNYPYIIYEAALIFENGSESLFDKIICVNTPIEIIHKRISTRNNYSSELINKIINSQLSQDYKCLKSDYCIYNKTKPILFKQIDNIHKSLI